MKPLAVLLVLLLAACTHASVRVDSGGGTVTTSTSVSAGYRGSSSAAWALIGIGLIAAEIAGSEGARERGLEPGQAPAQPMDATRQVNEVDCTKPIANWSANLKCR
jgi:hypothetical protein